MDTGSSYSILPFTSSAPADQPGSHRRLRSLHKVLGPPPLAAVQLEAFITMWVARFGMPAHITTNRGTSSPLARGRTGVRSRGSSTSPPQPTIPRPMAWWSGSTAS